MKLEPHHFYLPTDTSLEEVKPRCLDFKLVSALLSFFPEVQGDERAHPVSRSMGLMTVTLRVEPWGVLCPSSVSVTPGQGALVDETSKEGAVRGTVI